ncbi:hypothetical protein SELMODRAFT_439945 [Selaginella moellendorffii]|uniref:GDP-D-glucose phosphorylase 1 n=1 Tax=Selaginella moellendorffii TaxID=88036 RepID=D8R8G5_SELML|nr:GDP-L-galactose phosphorylase 1 [Selaginella moellendorffii]XP_024528004.1 GDP-L-galactose phosphorylase 1 [Selaginella moellendorffii]EFJ31692.1 hypothetical protein SELMODRAFT_439945 [Selaginella moellendorffii]|eukprot:XP_002967093.1 GDP-L-galactose phosphorylase 1 [Selaginella moellendorffii]
MLAIKRVPTVVSVNQDCGSVSRDCLQSCFLTGFDLPLFKYTKKMKTTELQLLGDEEVPSSPPTIERSFLGTLLLSKWEERASQGLFRYDVTACESRVLSGNYGFIAQLNEGRHLKKRLTEFRVDQVLQEFDPKKFNFSKVNRNEVLFQFGEGEEAGYYDITPILSSPDIVLINVSPIEYGHVLLVPRLFDFVPQRLCANDLLLALYFTAEVDCPYFRVGYNSLGAFATINHLHFQAYYLAYPFPVECASITRINKGSLKSSLRISELVDYPVKGVVYESMDLNEIAISVASTCQELELRNIPFNLLICDCGTRVFLFPQCFARKQALHQVSQKVLDTQVNPAAWEIGGHIVLKRKEDYEHATEEFVTALLAEVSLSDPDFQDVKNIICK